MVILLVVICGYSIGGYLWLFYWWLFVVILLVAICGYSIGGYLWLFYWWLFVVILLVAIGVILLMVIFGYYITKY